MAHKYRCETCGQDRTCNIKGCDGDCVKQCVPCLRGRHKAYTERIGRDDGYERSKS